MGIKYLLQTPTKNECYLVIDEASIDKLIESKITYPTKEVLKWRQGEKDYLVIHFWKGEKPVESVG